MEEEEDKDYLNFKNDKDILISINNEKILFSYKIIKKNSNLIRKEQERNIVITNKALYNFENKSE